ncbi:MAG TPA: ROK family protein [Acidimicrobiales bacterium]|nr:ROK family protein [Acidimicrobiales bacterium]
MPDPTGSVLALDVGGTKIAAALVDPDGTLSGRASIATPRDRDAKELMGDVVVLVRRVQSTLDVTPRICGVGCGGPMDAETVSPLNIPAWRRFPLAQMLGDELGLDVVVDNDAKALALAEGWLGAARGSRNFLAMVVSTGVGGGLVLDGRLLGGRLGNAGHVGHVIVEPDGRACSCGSHGCLEAEASGSAIEAVTGAPAALAPVDMRVRSGTLVGRAIASVASLLDLDLAVVGGSVALGFGEAFFEAAEAELSARARLDFSRACRVIPVRLGDRAPLVGAGAIAMRHLGASWIPQ